MIALVVVGLWCLLVVAAMGDEPRDRRR